MRHRGFFALLGSFVVVLGLSGAVWLTVAVKAYGGLAPLGSEQFRVLALSPTQVRFRYWLPRGLAWPAAYERLTKQGWVIRDDELLVWPDLMDDRHTAAIFLRFGWLPLGRQRLSIQRDAGDPQRFVVEVTQCTPIALLASCG